MSRPITVLVQFQPKAGAEQNLSAALRETIAGITANAACTGAQLLVDEDGVPTLVETWADVGAHEQYVQRLVDEGVMGRVMTMCSAPPVSRYFEELAR